MPGNRRGEETANVVVRAKSWTPMRLNRYQGSRVSGDLSRTPITLLGYSPELAVLLKKLTEPNSSNNSQTGPRINQPN